MLPLKMLDLNNEEDYDTYVSRLENAYREHSDKIEKLEKALDIACDVIANTNYHFTPEEIEESKVSWKELLLTNPDELIIKTKEENNKLLILEKAFDIACEWLDDGKGFYQTLGKEKIKDYFINEAITPKTNTEGE